VIFPTSHKETLKFAQERVAECSISMGSRQALCQQYYQWVETGRASGVRALVNKLYAHLDNLASHLFSPSDLRFHIDFETPYDTDFLKKAEMASRVLTREWQRHDIDMIFASAVPPALQYGAAFICQNETFNGVTGRLVMPWNLGVYNETINNLDDQEAILETMFLTKSEVWRRISHLPDAEKLYKRIVTNARQQSGVGTGTSFFHQVLSTSTLDTSLTSTGNRIQSGGIVQLSNDPGYAIMGPDVAAEMIKFHQLYVVDDERGDWTTIQMVDPDVIIAPIFKRSNMFVKHRQPYSIIQPNYKQGYIWGRSEITDLIEPQNLSATWWDDIRRVMGTMYDKLLAFPGYDGLTDELYDQFRAQGYMGLPQGADVKDLTPKLPQEAFTAVEMLYRQMDAIAGFDNILSGQGQSGVRAGVHAETLTRNASPRLRDRSLLVERQCAAAADKTFALLQAKDASAYWTDANNPEPTQFLLSQLPDDIHITVDSHSSSPIYEEDHRELIAFGIKSGFITGETAIEELPFPSKDLLLARLKQQQEQHAKLLQEHPELLAKEVGKHHR